MATAATVQTLGLTLDMVQGMTAGNTVANLLRIDGGTNDVLNLNAAGITAATVAVGNAFFNDVTIAGQTYDVARYTHNGQNQRGQTPLCGNPFYRLHNKRGQTPLCAFMW